MCRSLTRVCLLLIYKEDRHATFMAQSAVTVAWRVFAFENIFWMFAPKNIFQVVAPKNIFWTLGATIS